jgi:putative nucleotidyltransferase with HDIG domain
MISIRSVYQFFLHFRKNDEKLKFSKTKAERKRELAVRLCIAVLLGIALVLLFPKGRSLQFADMKEGSISTRRIIAPFTFEILRTKEEVRRDREIAAEKVYPVFNLDNKQIRNVIKEVEYFFEEVSSVRKISSKDSIKKQALRDSLLNHFPVKALEIQYWDFLTNSNGKIAAEKLRYFREVILKVIRDIMAVGILSIEKERVTIPDRRLVLLEKNQEVIYQFSDFYDLNESMEKVNVMMNDAYPEDGYFSQLGFGIINFFLRPNFIYNEEIHQERKARAMARVPLSSGFVRENEKIVDTNERITPEIRKKLVSLSTKMAEKSMGEGGIKRVFPILGKFAFVAVILFLLFTYIMMEKPVILRRNKSILLIALIILFVSLTTFFIHKLEGSEYLAPIAVGAMLFATIFDSRIGYAGTAVLSVLVGGIWGNEFSLMAISFFTGVVGVLVIKRVRNRSQLIQTVFYMIGVYIFSITFMGFLSYQPFREIIQEWQYGALNGLFAPIISYGLLALIESSFDITTDFTLLELSNLNHPLLKKLSLEAPGTYHHSILVGNFSEAAAQAVGANSLLARVGSYYHDIGKLEKSEYFVENQFGGQNPHNKLTTRMSALILSNHVKKGSELAAKYHLPTAIRDIMIQHHGTTLMSYFFQKALSTIGTEKVNENDYRYPGPRPQTKEAAIVMLADAVEAAARSLKDPTHSRLKGLIEDLVDERFQASELDETPLTLRDLQKIKESILKILAATFHARIEYTDLDDTKSQQKSQKSSEDSSAGRSI